MKATESLQKLMDDIDRERVERARTTPYSEKFLAGFQLFQRAIALMTAGVRAQFPNADENEIQRIVDERLELTRDADELHIP